MKTTPKVLLSLFAATLFLWACSSSDDPTPMTDDDVSMTDDVDPTDDDPTDDGTLGSSDGQITFPEGTDIDLTGAAVTIAGEVIPIADLENIALPTFDGASELAFLTDNQGNILLAGFIDEDRNQLSIASTATVLYYFASTGYLQAEEFKADILTGIEENENYTSFAQELETLFVNDPLVINTMGFLDALEESVSGFRSVGTINNAIFVESNDIRSQLQLKKAADGGNSFTITNRGARRAKLFAYKKAFTDMEGNRTVLIDNVGLTQQAEFDETIFQGRYNSKNFPAAGPVNNGNLIHALIACGNIFTETTTAPQTLNLGDDESSVEYEITVIGPGQNNDGRIMTTAERMALEQISTETFLLDYALPTLFEIAGRKQAYDNLEGTTRDSALLPLIESYFDNNTSVRELVFEGEFNSALQLFFEDVQNSGQVFQLLEQAYEIVFNDNDISGSFVFTDTLSDNLVHMTEIITGITSRFSLFCTDDQLDDISTLESWEVTADRGDVTLEPLRGGVQTFQDLEITADVEGFEEEELSNGSITYEWTVSENFDSTLRDNQGNSGLSFTNTNNTVIFQSLASGNDLVDFENLETVTVRAFQDNNGNQVLIGTAEMTVNVQERRFFARPDNILLRGIEQANLSIVNFDYSPLVANDDFDFRLVWTTDGAHALFNGTSTSETVFNNNSIIIRNLDDKVDDAIQEVRVGIWLRPKNNPDAAFREADFAFIDVYINNDNTIEFEVAALGGVVESYPDGPGTRALFHGGFRPIPYYDKAVRYDFEVIEYGINGTVIENATGLSRSWTNESWSINQGIGTMSFIQSAGNPNSAVVDDPTTGFAIGLTGASVNTGFPQFADIQSDFASIFGTAKVIITLEN